ncbi:hypothetical protein JTE90_028976 [Oedothorax gibbosus]|uniref:No apical meristem-associated C-terminal domain-containing protein n=1 Tax=Oedothorax gibbosus TaxID=931172 RepID=A0AAV6VGY1_9ARAC|nr:hypothetical protein JTE90_028976 [Oedothorax gibbosus]
MSTTLGQLWTFWRETYEERKNFLKSTEGGIVFDIIEEWPSLKQPLGYTLIDTDFHKTYPQLKWFERHSGFGAACHPRYSRSSGLISPLPHLAPSHTSTPQTSAPSQPSLAPVRPSTPRSPATGPPNKKVKLTNAAHNKAILEIESKKVDAIGELLSRRKENEDRTSYFFAVCYRM